MGQIDAFAAIEPIDLADEPEFDLGGLRVIPPQRVVVMDGERRELQPRVMQVLVALAKARSAVLSRQRLSELCWDGRIVGDDALNHVILALRRLADEFTPSPFAIETVPRVGHRLVESPTERQVEAAGATRRGSRSTVAAAIAILALLALVAVVLARPWMNPEHAPTVLVTTAAKDSASRQLATDLANQLGSLQASHPAAIRLLGGTAKPSENPDLVLQVSRVGKPAAARAHAVLTAGAGRTTLWSRDFEQATHNPADLRQQIAYTAAQVLRCASEGLGSDDALSQETLKTYLNACAAMADDPAYDGRPVVRALETVVGSSPGFVGGWAKLLQAESSALASPIVRAGLATAPTLRRHIATARRLEPELPEAYLAEYDLTRPSDFLGRAKLVDKVVERNPNHAGVRQTRAYFFASVGAMGDAAREAREAVRLDPLSPSLRDGLVGALIGAGNMKAALAQVEEVERLWPGASSTIEARYRFELRYGNARKALDLIDSGATDSPIAPAQRTFLLARINPSQQNVESSIRQDRKVYAHYPQSIFNYAQTLAEFDQKEELLDLLLNPLDPKELALNIEVVFRPAFSEVLDDPRLMLVAKRIGLLDYWWRSGNWPDFCYAPDLPYDCKAEAAKLGS